MRRGIGIAIGVGALVGSAAALHLRPWSHQLQPSAVADHHDSQPEAIAAPSLGELVRAEALWGLGSYEAANVALAPLLTHASSREPALRLLAWNAYAQNDAARLAQLASQHSAKREMAFLQAALAFKTQPHVGQEALAQQFWDAPDTAFGWAALRELAAGHWTALTPIERDLVLAMVTPTTPKVAFVDDTTRALMLEALAAKAPTHGTLRLALDVALGYQALQAERFTQAIGHFTAAQRARGLSAHNERAVLAALGEAHRRRGDYQAARKIFTTLGKEDDVFAAQALAAQGEMAIEHRRYNQAEEHFLAQLTLHPVGEARHAALFGLGFVAFRTARFGEARRFFHTLLTEAPVGQHAAAAAYWEARSREESGDLLGAQAELAALIERFGRDYYAFMASTRVGPAKPTHRENLPQPAANSDVQLVAALVEGGQHHRAKALLQATCDAAEHLSDQDLLLLRDSANELSAHDVLKQLHPVLDARFSAYPEARARLRQSYATHQQNVSLLTEAALTRRISAGAMVAAAYQRSVLSSHVTGGRGELGFLQLPRNTLAALWRENHSRKTATAADLVHPTHNAELSARYFSRILRAFDGRLSYAFAALHAGPGAVTRWREARGDLPDDIFVEEIPYGDTRAFVKASLATLQAYTGMTQSALGNELAQALSR